MRAGAGIGLGGLAGLAVLACGGHAATPGKPAAAGPLTPAQIMERAKPSIVLIKTERELGTGFVVWGDGRIATNLHVVIHARAAMITLADGREFDRVHVLAIDPDHDLAIVQVPARGLPALPLADSDKVKEGESVVAIGHPLGLGNTVSDGIVSAVRELAPELKVLQITAPIAPGSSGGPLFNDRGEVIGVATAFASEGQNVNFGMPSNYLKPMMLRDDGVPLAAVRWPEGPRREPRPSRPTHDVALLAGCTDDELREIVVAISKAIDVGAPLFNQGDHEGCFRIYEGTALAIDHGVTGCPGPRKALLDGVAKAGALATWTEKAWAMRDAFDGVLDVIDRKLAK